MPKQNFKLSPQDARLVSVEWKGMWKNVQVGFDGQPLGTIPDSKALKAGQTFSLPDGTQLGVRLKTGMQAGLEITRDGRPLPGSGGDPEVQIKLARNIVWFIGGLSLVAGLAAELAKVEFLLNMGIGWISAAVGVVFLVLGYFVGKRSMVALGLAVGLLITDTVLTLALSAGTGRVPTAGLAMRVVFLIFLFQGFKAIKAIKSAESLKGQANVF
jgi:hypothetical protein